MKNPSQTCHKVSKCFIYFTKNYPKAEAKSSVELMMKSVGLCTIEKLNNVIWHMVMSDDKASSNIVHSKWVRGGFTDLKRITKSSNFVVDVTKCGLFTLTSLMRRHEVTLTSLINRWTTLSFSLSVVLNGRKVVNPVGVKRQTITDKGTCSQAKVQGIISHTTRISARHSCPL